MIKRYCILFFAVTFHSLLMAQPISRYNTFSYNVNEGLLQSTITGMAFDKNNFCWLSFPNGIQKFDGKNFITVPVQPGLPDDKGVLFFRCSNGDLLISHSQGISKYEINNDRIMLVYTYPFAQKTPAQFIGEDEGVIYIYLQTAAIIGINCQLLKKVSEIKTGFMDYSSNGDYRPKVSDNIINHKTVLLINFTLYLWDLKNRKLVMQSEPINDISRIFLRLKTENEILFCNNKVANALQLYSFATHKISMLPVKGKDDIPIGRCCIYFWQKKLLISFNNRIYETDSTLQVLKSELVNFQNQPVAGSQTIAGIKEDNFGNLFLQTISGGIKKIIRNNYPFKYWSSGKPDSNFVIAVLPDKINNRVLAGTSGNGLLIFDTLQRLVKHIKILPGRNLPATVSSIIKTNQDSYLLFIVGEKVVWELSHDFSKLKSIPILTSLPGNTRGLNYFANLLSQNEHEAIIQSQYNLYKIDFTANTVQEHPATTGYTMSGIKYNTFIITHANDELIFLDAATFKVTKKIPFKNTGNVRCFAKDEVNNIYIGSNKGIFKIDSAGKILQQLDKERGLPDECIYAMAFDDDGFLWCSTNKGLLKINKDNSLQQFKKEDGLQENEFNTNAVAKAEDGELFFGGVNGLSSFYPSGISSFEERIQFLLTKIRVNNQELIKDTATWNIKSLRLPYTQNALSFDFLAMGNNNPDQYIYQYRMDGVDKEWVQNNELQTVRYSLPPGKYTFKIYASRFFDKNAKPMKEIEIIIQPPFWKTWWFLTGLGIIFSAGLIFAINQYTKAKYKKKLAEMEGEYKIQLERERISRDLHDSIGAYANAVLYNTELLQKENDSEERHELMNDLKFASKDIITSLRETIWALKKDQYTAEDCFLRIRNFIQPFSRYYPYISFRIEGETPSDFILHYTKALNVVRIVQESLSNAIKHAGAKSINIMSSVENNNWKITVSDDGKGFDYAKAYELQQGNGLKNIKQRAEESGFDLFFESKLQQGTVISILIHRQILSIGIIGFK